MKISKTIETPDGGIQFEGELNSDELDVILSVGLNYLYQQGAIPFKVLPEKAAINFVEGSQEQQ